MKFVKWFLSFLMIIGLAKAKAQPHTFRSGLYCVVDKGGYSIKEKNNGGKSLITYQLSQSPFCSIKDFASVNDSIGQYNNPVMIVQFTEIGKRKLAKTTAKYINRKIAIVIANQLISVVTVTAPIPGGRIQVSGNLTRKEIGELTTKVEMEIANSKK